MAKSENKVILGILKGIALSRKKMRSPKISDFSFFNKQQMSVINDARRLVEREVGVALAQISAHGRGIRAVIDGDVFAAARLVGGAARREAVPLNIITDVIPVIVPSLFIFPISPKC